MAWVKVGTRTTGPDGKVTFDGLPYGNYRYEQTSAMDGYVRDTVQHDITISSGTPAVEEARYNTPEFVGSLEITKVNGTYNWPLAGGKFKLTDANDKVLVTLSDPTGSNGKLVFNNLMTMASPKSYKFVEEEAPAGYDPSTTEYTKAVSIGLTATETVPNTPQQSGEISVDLADTNYHEFTMPNITYDIYADI